MSILYDLEHTILFRDIDFKALARIAQFCTLHTYGDGDFLVEEDKDPGNFDLFILRSGTVEVVSNNSNSVSGEVVLSPQDIELFGEISWLTKKKRTASVRCRSAAEVIRINGDQLEAFIEANPQAGLTIMRQVAHMLAERLSETDNLLKQILWNTGV